MTDRTLLVVLVALATLAVAPLGAAGAFADGSAASQNGMATPTPTPDGSQATTGNDSNASLGASVSAFMQASAAEAEGQVDRGMFAARFNDSDNRTRDRLVRQRAANLEDRVAELRAERKALLDDGKVTLAERARAARLSARIDALRDAINQTDHAAERANVSLNRTKLLALREAAGNLSGPEVAALATDLVERPDRGRGPPTDVGNGTDAGPPDDAGNATNASETDGTPDGPGTGGDDSGNDNAGGAKDGAGERDSS